MPGSPKARAQEIRKLSLDSHGREGKNSDNILNNGNGHNQRNRYRIVRGEHNLVDSLNNGWNLVKDLAEDKFILKRDREGI